MKTKIVSAFIVLGSMWSVFFNSCRAPMDIDTRDADPTLVIYGLFTDEEVHQTVNISSSSPYFDTTRNSAVSGAKVWVAASSGETYDYLENDTLAGQYHTASKVAGHPGTTYTLNVEVDFNDDGTPESHTASSTMLPVVEVDSVKLELYKILGLQQYSLNIYGQEPGDTEDYYLQLFHLNDTAIFNTLNKCKIMMDRGFNGEYLDGMSVKLFRIYDPEAEEEKEKEEDGQAQRTHLKPGDKLTFGLAHIEKGYFDFISQARSSMNGEIPFFGSPAANITTNLSGGAVGYFATYSHSRKSVIVEENDPSPGQ